MMDMFMDKLAQKLTAQEIIRANTAADTEELGKLRNRVAEYNECLERLQRLIEEGTAKIGDAQVNGAEIDRLVQESIEKIKELQQNTEILEQMAEGFGVTNENMHRECVKVYRNVQAVVVEESGKQSDALAAATAKVMSLKGKLNAILGISVTALIISLAGVAIQILNLLNFKLF